MSMNADFVQVSPDELAALVDDPSSVIALFHEGAPGSFGLLMSDAVRERLERLSPQVLEGAMQGLDPRLQDELAKRIGVVREALGSEESGKAIFRLMESRGLVRPGDPEAPSHARLSLDKAWHGVHFLLTGQAEPAGGPLGGVILGGTELGEDEGYGPARYFSAGEVEAIARALGRDGLEDELASRYEPERMNELGIYPGGWDQSESGWLLDAFRELRAFFGDAAAHERAVVTCLV